MFESRPHRKMCCKGASGTLFALAEREGTEKPFSNRLRLEIGSNPVLTEKMCCKGASGTLFALAERGGTEKPFSNRLRLETCSNPSLPAK